MTTVGEDCEHRPEIRSLWRGIYAIHGDPGCPNGFYGCTTCNPSWAALGALIERCKAAGHDWSWTLGDCA